MQFLNFVLHQIDEACRLIKDGRLSHLRLALLLLDNAAEIQLARCVEFQLMHEVTEDRLRETALEIPPEARDEYLRELIEKKSLSFAEKNAVLRQFDEKVRYLTDRAKQLDQRLGAALCHLHRYRNEAYHSARVRKETLGTATKLLLEINCEMLLSISRGFTTYASDDDYSWLSKRFTIECQFPVGKDQELVKVAVGEFRASASLDASAVRELLIEHITKRLEATMRALRFVVDNSNCPNMETAIRDSFHCNLYRRKSEGVAVKPLEVARDRHTLAFIQNVRESLVRFYVGQHELDAFGVFGEIEQQFEPVEESVQVLEAELDAAIQLQIDIARGK